MSKSITYKSITYKIITNSITNSTTHFYEHATRAQLFAADAGFKSRFTSTAFDDFTFEELLAIMQSLG